MKADLISQESPDRLTDEAAYHLYTVKVTKSLTPYTWLEEIYDQGKTIREVEGSAETPHRSTYYEMKDRRRKPADYGAHCA